ncbi:MAG: fructose-bisphosphate aldolase [Thermoplasmata archaeon]|nr:class I fructose-bisphosphate aldolase family protein [Euryarchaeota archaeon]RLF66430.1 MAG: fructose-bisphosphate aldolase [Thermoplasmata archaeon]
MSFETYNSIGKKVRISRILKNGRSVIFAMDHGMEHGPDEFPKEHLDPRVILRKVIEGGADAIMVNIGMAALSWDVWAKKVALIVKVTGKTSIRPKDETLLQSPTGLVEDAIKIGADGIAATVYWGSQYEHAMMEQFVGIASVCDEYGIPVLQLAYPRGPEIQNRYDPKIVRYGARAAAEIGADIIKTYWTGSKESFATVVEAASGVPVLMSGGPKTDTPLEFLKVARDVIDAGGAGVVVGRNVFQRSDPAKMMHAIVRVVHKDEDPEEVAKDEGLV